MAVIKDYMDGECHVVIHDDCLVKTPEEAEKIKRRMAEIYVYYRRKDYEESRRAEKKIS